MASKVVLITGANRGFGRALVERFLALPNHTVIAANRSPEHPTSQTLAELPKGKDSRVIVVKYDAAVEQDAFDAVKEIEEKHGIDHLDIVVPNAAIAKSFPFVREVKRADIREHVEVNVLSVISLYQATRDLLQKSLKGPIFAPMGSLGGTLGRQPNIPSASYGPSKAMVSWYGIRINTEDEWLNAFVLDPGWAGTDMGTAAAKALGAESAMITVDEAMDGVFKVLTTATKEKCGGKFMSYTGEAEIW
ncbi:putative NADPH-dependent 1-acyl dihydroxyacetone phosphate reductase [Durotheca rogersii]|uniref:putative NADPH-dependent 1-acyl dihydroxyacetone phosphate reductase n=1 Tax=Durotheca rogersii TaxID=419775 RepID=UPI00221F2399|nr:putative NADPH-dependent 1-acyl dihydroxyacetone phosphate reductase [Durotheca rogersii]KAI5865245.1 putative NADPH-dependent 1-acyl dihydroxyacetone phosphate reductase [Durotheca rogersii]